jgi:hypothetical protein
MEHCDPEMHEDILNNVVEFEQIFLDPVLAVHDVNVQRVELRFLCCGKVRIGGKLSNYTSTVTSDGFRCGNSNIVLNF